MDTSVLPYTADMEGYRVLSGRPSGNDNVKNSSEKEKKGLTSKRHSKKLVVSLKC
jgi:hypothetical protein